MGSRNHRGVFEYVKGGANQDQLPREKETRHAALEEKVGEGIGPPTRKGRLVVWDDSDGRETKGKKTMKRNSVSNKKPEARASWKPKNLQQMSEDF